MIITYKIVYSILPPSFANKVLNGEFKINEYYLSIATVFVKINGLDLLFYYSKMNNSCLNNQFNNRPENSDCIALINMIYEELDAICDFYGMVNCVMLIHYNNITPLNRFAILM